MTQSDGGNFKRTSRVGHTDTSQCKQRTFSIGCLFSPSQRGCCPLAATPIHHREDVVHWLQLLSITERPLSIGCQSCPSQRGHCPLTATPVHHREDVVHWLPLLSITDRTLSIGCPSCPSQTGRCPLAAPPVHHREDVVYWHLPQSITESGQSVLQLLQTSLIQTVLRDGTLLRVGIWTIMSVSRRVLAKRKEIPYQDRSSIYTPPEDPPLPLFDFPARGPQTSA